MKQNVKIKIMGKVQGVGYREFVQKHAHRLQIEGTIQNLPDESVVILASGPADNLDQFIDYLYKGSGKSKVENLEVEPLLNGKTFRGVFRILGAE